MHGECTFSESFPTQLLRGVRSSDKLFRIPDFFSEKIIVGPHEGEIPPPLAQMVLTQYTSIPELLVHHTAPPGGQI